MTNFDIRSILIINLTDVDDFFRENRHTTVLIATSGDTGSAAISALR